MVLAASTPGPEHTRAAAFDQAIGMAQVDGIRVAHLRIVPSHSTSVPKSWRARHRHRSDGRPPHGVHVGAALDVVAHHELRRMDAGEPSSHLEKTHSPTGSRATRTLRPRSTSAKTERPRLGRGVHHRMGWPSTPPNPPPARLHATRSRSFTGGQLVWLSALTSSRAATIAPRRRPTTVRKPSLRSCSVLSYSLTAWSSPWTTASRTPDGLSPGMAPRRFSQPLWTAARAEPLSSPRRRRTGRPGRRSYPRDPRVPAGP